MLNYAIIVCGRISYNHFAAALENKLNLIAFFKNKFVLYTHQCDNKRTKNFSNTVLYKHIYEFCRQYFTFSCYA